MCACPVILSVAKNPGFPSQNLNVLFILEKYQKLLLFCLLVLCSVSDSFLEIRKTPPDGRQTVPNFYKNFVNRKSKLTKIKKQNRNSKTKIRFIEI